MVVEAAVVVEVAAVEVEVVVVEVVVAVIAVVYEVNVEDRFDEHLPFVSFPLPSVEVR